MSETDKSAFPVAIVAVVEDVDRDAARETLRFVLSTINEQLSEQDVPIRFITSTPGDPDASPTDSAHMYDLRRNRRLCEVGDDDDQARAAQVDLVDAGVGQLGCVECLSRLVLREEATLALLRARIVEVAS